MKQEDAGAAGALFAQLQQLEAFPSTALPDEYCDFDSLFDDGEAPLGEAGGEFHGAPAAPPAGLGSCGPPGNLAGPDHAARRPPAPQSWT